MTTIQHKRTETQGKVPTANDMVLGEILMNVEDGRVFFKKKDGSVQELMTRSQYEADQGIVDGILGGLP